MWKDGNRELNTERYQASLSLLLEDAMERAVTERLRFLGEADLLLSLMTVNT